MGLRGDVGKIRNVRQVIAKLPITIAADVAAKAAPAMTGLARDAYSSGRTVYGDPRPHGVDGRALTLNATGETARDVRFQSVGTIVRCVLGPKWAKYLIGKYGILPNGALPTAWRKRIDAIVAQFKVAP